MTQSELSIRCICADLYYPGDSVGEFVCLHLLDLGTVLLRSSSLDIPTVQTRTAWHDRRASKGGSLAASARFPHPFSYSFRLIYCARYCFRRKVDAKPTPTCRGGGSARVAPVFGISNLPHLRQCTRSSSIQLENHRYLSTWVARSATVPHH